MDLQTTIKSERLTAQTVYSAKHKKRILKNRKLKLLSREQKINSYILTFDAAYFMRNKSSRRGFLHSIIISQFSVDMPYLTTSYNDFVIEFNKGCTALNYGSNIFINYTLDEFLDKLNSDMSDTEPDFKRNDMSE
jgi:hypothetical protein